jgi:hypothetical protein
MADFLEVIHGCNAAQSGDEKKFEPPTAAWMTGLTAKYG